MSNSDNFCVHTRCFTEEPTIDNVTHYLHNNNNSEKTEYEEFSTKGINKAFKAVFLQAY
jgi:hypothetical protein